MSTGANTRRLDAEKTDLCPCMVPGCEPSVFTRSRAQEAQQMARYLWFSFCFNIAVLGLAAFTPQAERSSADGILTTPGSQALDQGVRQSPAAVAAGGCYHEGDQARSTRRSDGNFPCANRYQVGAFGQGRNFIRSPVMGFDRTICDTDEHVRRPPNVPGPEAIAFTVASDANGRCEGAMLG